MSTNQHILRAQIIPLNKQTLLLPNTAVAEVVRFNSVESLPNDTPWIYGVIHWRGLSLPLLSVEGLLGDEVPTINDEYRVVVLNSLSNNREMPYIAIAAKGNPHLVKLLDEAMDDQLAEEHDSHYIYAEYSLGKENVLIPDINAIEESLHESLNF